MEAGYYRIVSDHWSTDPLSIHYHLCSVKGDWRSISVQCLLLWELNLIMALTLVHERTQRNSPIVLLATPPLFTYGCVFHIASIPTISS
jgi:hypothetical protein